MEIAFQVHAIGAKRLGFPHRMTDLHPARFHFVIAGDDAGPLITENADRHAFEPRTTDDLRARIERVGVAEANE